MFYKVFLINKCLFQCAYCSKEANFYCCWNTSYCDYPCQQAAWPEHMSKCTQTRTGAPQGETSSGGISVAGAETKPELARHTNISHRVSLAEVITGSFLSDGTVSVRNHATITDSWKHVTHGLSC